MSRLAGAGLAIALVALAGAWATRAAEVAAPMTNEDVVRLVAAGTPESDVLDAVRTRPQAFDVTEEMISELRLAGVPESILSAMKARAAPAAPLAAAARPPRGMVRITVALSGSRTIKTPEWADEDLKARLHLPKENEMRRVKDLAVFLACATTEHVPDQWRTKSPLGRDMAGTPRHEMLAFVPADTPDGKPPRLTLPATLEADVDDVEPHELVLGIAARIGDRWYTLAASVPVKVKAVSGLPPIAGRVDRGKGPFDPALTLKAPKATAIPPKG